MSAAFLSAPAYTEEDEEFDPDTVSAVDAINCHIDAPSYNGFALAVIGEDNIGAKRGWKKVKSANAFMEEYLLPAPIAVTGSFTTRRIAFTSSSIVAILDLPDPTPLARAENIANEMDPEPMIAAIVASGKASRAQVEREIKFRKFLGQRVLAEAVEPATEGISFGSRTIVARTISNATSHPGKTFYGCTYKIELLDKNGNPL